MYKRQKQKKPNQKPKNQKQVFLFPDFFYTRYRNNLKNEISDDMQY